MARVDLCGFAARTRPNRPPLTSRAKHTGKKGPEMFQKHGSRALKMKTRYGDELMLETTGIGDIRFSFSDGRVWKFFPLSPEEAKSLRAALGTVVSEALKEQ